MIYGLGVFLETTFENSTYYSPQQNFPRSVWISEQATLSYLGNEQSHVQSHLKCLKYFGLKTVVQSLPTKPNHLNGIIGIKTKQVVGISIPMLLINRNWPILRNWKIHQFWSDILYNGNVEIPWDEARGIWESFQSDAHLEGMIFLSYGLEAYGVPIPRVRCRWQQF